MVSRKGGGCRCPSRLVCLLVAVAVVALWGLQLRVLLSGTKSNTLTDRWANKIGELRSAFSPDSRLFTSPGIIKLEQTILTNGTLPEFEDVVEILSREIKDFTFVQIGAHVGTLNDPVFARAHSDGWRGLCLEPVPHLFKELVKNYGKLGQTGQVEFENAAAAEVNGVKPFYAIRPEVDTYTGAYSRDTNDGSGAAQGRSGTATVRGNKADTGSKAKQLGAWWSQLGTFDKKLMERSTKAAPDAVVTLEVPVFTFDTLVKRHQPLLSHVDYLQIDAEGYDWTLLQSIDLERWRPRLVRFEAKNLSWLDKVAVWKHLRAHGYVYRVEPEDCFAVLIGDKQRTHRQQVRRRVFMVVCGTLGLVGLVLWMGLLRRQEKDGGRIPLYHDRTD